MKLLLGTTNAAKIEDYKRFLIHADLELLTLKEIGFTDEPLEIGKTFEENALQKAKFYGNQTEYPTLADDGGFEIDALDGRPGVESKRWLGPSATDEQKIQKVLELLKGVPAEHRTARLRNVTVVYFPKARDYIVAEGQVEGVVLDKAGDNIITKFPYRSILFLPVYQKFYSELDRGQAHRKQICKKLLLKLEPWVNA